MLPSDRFRTLIKDSVLFALDLLIEVEDGRFLVGLRRNSPAKGSWMLPGGRVFKGETLTEALLRISVSEIGCPLSPRDFELRGLYDHVYEDNAFDEPGYGTHYVVAAGHARLERSRLVLPDGQHTRYRFLNVRELLADPEVNDFTKAYFVQEPPNLFVGGGMPAAGALS